MKAMDIRRTGVAALVACLLAAPTLAGSIPTVGGLYTSQGCNSCPG